MPTYEFECRDCRQTFAVKASVSEYTAMRRERQIVCPACGATRVARVFSAPSIAATSSTPHQGGTGCCPGGRCR